MRCAETSHSEGKTSLLSVRNNIQSVLTYRTLLHMFLCHTPPSCILLWIMHAYTRQRQKMQVRESRNCQCCVYWLVPFSTRVFRFLPGMLWRQVMDQGPNAVASQYTGNFSIMNSCHREAVWRQQLFPALEIHILSSKSLQYRRPYQMSQII